MNRAGRWLASALATAVLSASSVCAAATDSKRVAAVDPDEELARALNIALSPWGTTVTRVRLEKPGPLEAERARTIARDTHADVVMWVAARGNHYSVWIYDVASDHTSLRDLTTSPPFDATTAAAVALSIKALLRLTVVAPPAERVAPEVRPEADWVFGAAVSLADHEGAQSLAEPRGSLYASYWPPLFGHHVGAELALSAGVGVNRTATDGSGFTGAIDDYGGRLGIGARTPIAKWLAVELSLGFAVHLIHIHATLDPPGALSTVSSDELRVDTGFEPQLAFNIMVFGDSFRVTPFTGVTVLTKWQRVSDASTNKIEMEQGPLTVEVGVRAELLTP